MKRRLCVLAVAFLPPFLLFSQQIDYKGFPEWSLLKKDSTEYALYTPSKMEPGKKYPIALFMHGCCGKTVNASLRNAVDPPVRMWHNFGANTQQIPTYIISPATMVGWSQHFKNLKAVMDDLVANHQGDPQRIYVCGFSMGGMGTYEIIQAFPGYFAAAITMGMNFSGDSTKVKDLPMWMNQGETDWWSRSMRRQVADIRLLNGNAVDTGFAWVTGVNPRYTNFKGMGHSVQWPAVSTQDITAWAYSKINDGNKYPTVFFTDAQYPVKAGAGKPVTLSVTAKDADGSIESVDFFINKTLFKTLTAAPYEVVIMPGKGDNIVEATARDNGNKTSTAVTRVKVNIQPLFISGTVPSARAGEYYYTKLEAAGNGELQFSLKKGNTLPDGIRLYPDGTIKGMTAMSGNYRFGTVVKDEDAESSTHVYTLRVTPKKAGEILVSNIVAASGSRYRLSKMMEGEAPFFNSKSKILSTEKEEINFSNLSVYKGFTLIQTDMNDADTSVVNFLSFNADEPAVIYVAYEKLDHLFSSTVPAWLNDFKKEPGQIVAQYRYYDVYSKKFPKGKIVLPSAEAKVNKVGTNYFIMVKKQ